MVPTSGLFDVVIKIYKFVNLTSNIGILYFEYGIKNTKYYWKECKINLKMYNSNYIASPRLVVSSSLPIMMWHIKFI